MRDSSGDRPTTWSAELYSPRALTEGERWTADALHELRRARYMPRAWRRFLRRSLERSGETRRARPRLTWQGRRWGVVGAVAWLGACRLAAGREDLRFHPLGGLVWWAAVWQMLDWHLGMAEGGDGRPRDSLSPADAFSLVRFWLVPAIWGTERSELTAVIVLGGLTDWLDGELARRRGRTRLGRDLDTTADLAFLGLAAVRARRVGVLPVVGFWALAVRYAVGMALALGAVFGRARRPAIRAMRWGMAPRVAGLALCTAGCPTAGTATLLIGCAVPPRSTAPHLSPA